MTLAERLAQIEAAAAQPGGLALRAVERMTADQPDLLRALECAAVPHWWDAASLGPMLDPDMAGAAHEWHQQLLKLSVVEPYLSRPGASNVHEVTRAALREKLHTEGRLPALSARAFAAGAPASPNSSPAQVIEQLYHQLLADPESGAKALEAQWRDWNDHGRWADLLDLAAALEELLPYLAPVARARALLRRATIRQDRRPVAEIASQASESADIFRQINDGRSLGQALNLCGKLAVAQGDLAGAMRLFGEDKAITERLANSDPGSAQWQRDLSVSLDKLGDLAIAQGDLAGASRSFTESKAIAERLAASDPANAQWQRDLSVSLYKLGDLAVAQGDLADASRRFSESKAIAERLSASDPANAQWQRDLSVSLNKLGDLAVAQGDLPGASRCFTESKAIRERLAASDPANAEWQRDLSVSLNRLGGLAVAKGDLPDAWRSFTESKAIAERLAASDPANAGWQRDLSISLNTLGELAGAQGDLPGALRSFTEAKAIAERLAASDPANAGWQRDLSFSLNKLGDLAVAQGDLPGALRSFTEDMVIAERLAASDPANAGWQRDLAVSRLRLAEVAEARGDAVTVSAELQACFKMLEGMKQRAMHMDPPLASLHEELARRFSQEPG